MDNLYTRIDDYLDGTLSETERTAFEAEVAADPETAAAFEQVREARERLGRRWSGEQPDAALQQTLNQLGKHYFQGAPIHKSKKRPVYRLWWAVAAGLALVFAAWFFLRPPQQERLYARYRQFPEASFIERGNPAQQDLQTATLAFNQKKYAEALAALLRIRQGNPSDLEVAFFTGLCQLELGQSDAAQKSLEPIAASSNSWAAEANWYLALSYLRRKNLEKCVETLRRIPSDNQHYTDAQALIATLGASF